MLYAEKGNKVKQINESDIQRYVEQGFQIKDGTGAVIRETVPTDVPTLRLAYTQHSEEIKKLKAEIAMLSAQIEKANKIIAERPPKTENAEQKSAEPKSRRKSANTEN